MQNNHPSSPCLVPYILGRTTLIIKNLPDRVCNLLVPGAKMISHATSVLCDRGEVPGTWY